MDVEDIKISTRNEGKEQTTWVAHMPTGLVLSTNHTDQEKAQRELINLMRSTLDNEMIYN